MTKTKHHFINGQWCSGEGKSFFSTNPVTGEIIWTGRIGQSKEINEAMLSARKAQLSWSGLNTDQRISYLQQFAQVIENNKQELAQIISLETGKPTWEALTEVHSVSAKIPISIQAYQQRNKEEITPAAEASAALRFKPHGVVVVLGAYNFPAHLSNGHIVPALLAGNTVIYKPSELTPMVAEYILDCWQEAGLPPGVLNCLQGDGSTGKELLQQDIQGVFFTGSYRTGRLIHQQFAKRPEVILALEMGGNNPLVIDEVENIDSAVYLSILSCFITAGQRCTCARRLFIKNDKQGDLFLNRFIQITKALKVGAYDEQPEPFMGSVISVKQAKYYLRAQKKLCAKGGIPLLEMKLLKKNSALLSPGIIDMTAVEEPDDEEFFAPLVQVYRYQHLEEAIAKANKTKYGLAAGIICHDRRKYEFFYQHIRAGLINWNRPTTGAASTLPFGGVGCSGNHRPSAYFAADYCAYPVASMENDHLISPSKLLPGIDMS